MNHRFATVGLACASLALTATVVACGSSTPAAAPPATTTEVSAPPPGPAPTLAPAPASADASAAVAPAPAAAPAAAAGSGSALADGGAPQGDIVTTVGVTSVSNEIATPKVTSPDAVIATLRPKFNACYQAGLKKDPKLAGSVTLSARIEKDGTVSAVTPKVPEGLSPAVIKCLGDHVKAANFAPSGGMSYATSLDIPVRFATN